MEERQLTSSLCVQVVLQDGPANCTVIVGLVRLTLGLSGLWCSSVVDIAPAHEAIVSPTVNNGMWLFTTEHRSKRPVSQCYTMIRICRDQGYCLAQNTHHLLRTREPRYIGRF
jgi:hypothetical protein